MILGKIFGRITTTEFKFLVEKETKKFEFVQVMHKVYEWVLCQVIEIERTDKDIANCIVIGYKDDKGRIKPIRIPFEQNAEVIKAEDEFIKSVIKLEDCEKGAFIGRLDGKNIDVILDLKKLLTKHIAILAKSGAGKSYTSGVLIEEIIDKKVPLLIIDPHGEYSSLKSPNIEEKEILSKYDLKPLGFTNIHEYGDSKSNPELRPLKLNNNLSPVEITHLIPGKLTNTQLGLLYSAVKHLDVINFTNVLFELEKEENNTKWTIINNLEYLNNLDIFTESYLPYNEIIQLGKCTIINLKGISPDVQEIIVYKLMKDLFELRKKEKIPPFFCVVEEAHNYCPERSFGETRCSKILRTVASEGRKFGLGLCIISQRPARVDKSVLSQCTTQIILKVTNPSDLKSIANSVEGITNESENEIKNLPIGTALITGVVDMPLFVNIRPRKTKHGGHAVNILEQRDEEKFFEKVQEFNEKELLPVIMPKITKKDLKIMSDREIKGIETTLIPGYLILCSEKRNEFNLLIEMINGDVIIDLDNFKTKKLPSLENLSSDEIRVLHTAFKFKNFEEEDLIKKLSFNAGNIIEGLIKKKLLVKTGNKISLSDEYIFSHLSNNACFEKIQFVEINYNNRLNRKISIDRIKENISKFCTIKDMRECYILRYDIVY
ncbi:ATP-binding protein [Candidatus Woesearchaeota archaeon]|nr:ATP-binding protein [Candidatus Woesearchaeota archaeon]